MPSRPMPPNTVVIRDAEAVVRHAWLRDLVKMRDLAEKQLHAAVADGLRAYDALHRACQSGEPRGIGDAQVAFEAAMGLTQDKTLSCERIQALVDTEFAPEPEPASALVTASARNGGAFMLSLMFAVIIRQLGRIAMSA